MSARPVSCFSAEGNQQSKIALPLLGSEGYLSLTFMGRPYMSMVVTDDYYCRLTLHIDNKRILLLC